MSTPIKNPVWNDSPTPAAAGTEQCNSVAISQDGALSAGGTFFMNFATAPASQNVGLSVWNNAGNVIWNDQFIATAPAVSTGAQPGAWTRGGIISVAMSRDGAWAASGGAMRADTAGTLAGFVDVYDLASKTKTPLAIAGASVHSVALSADGSCLVAGADAVYIFTRSTTGVWNTTAQVVLPTTGNAQRVAVSDSGEWIAAAMDDGWVALVHNPIATGAAPTTVDTWRIPQPTNPAMSYHVQAVGIAADGSGIVAGSNNAKVYYFDVAKANASGTLKPAWHHNLTGCSSARWVAAADDGSLIAVVASGGTVGHPDGTGKVILLQNDKTSAKNVWGGEADLARSPNSVSMGKNPNTGEYYVAASDGTPSNPTGQFYLLHWSSIATKPPMGSTTPPDPILWESNKTNENFSVAISADANAVVGGDDSGNVYYFSVP